MTALRTLTPIGWVAVAFAVIAAVVVVLGGLGFRWDPLDLNRRRLEHVEAALATASAEATARSAEAAAQRAQVARLDAVVETRVALERATSLALHDARTADDASLPLDPDRLGRLHAHDGQLCRLAPDLDGCAAPPGPAAGGRAVVRPAPAG